MTEKKASKATRKSGKKTLPLPPAELTAASVKNALKASLAEDSKAAKQTEKEKYNYNFVSSVLHDLRIKARISLPRLAKKTGFSENYLYRLESAPDSEVRISTLIIILDAMGYDLFIVDQKQTNKMEWETNDTIKA